MKPRRGGSSGGVGVGRRAVDRWLALSPRTRAIVTSALAVVLLACAILVVSALSAPRDRAEPVIELTDAQRSDLALREGFDAMGSGDTSAAIVLLEEALRLNPDNEAARDALSDVRAREEDGQTDEPAEATDPDPDTEPNPDPNDPAFEEEVDDLSTLLPRFVEGYQLGSPAASPVDVTVSGSPVDPDALASRALWTVHDRETNAGAAEFVASVSKSLYGLDVATVPIDGVDAYFGTDGTRFATVVYVRGRYVFEVVLTSISVTPSRLRVEAEAAALAFPDVVE